jgi:hypothetical protein
MLDIAGGHATAILPGPQGTQLPIFVGVARFRI